MPSMLSKRRRHSITCAICSCQNDQIIYLFYPVEITAYNLFWPVEYEIFIQ